jgi:hypothetical protein
VLPGMARDRQRRLRGRPVAGRQRDVGLRYREPHRVRSGDDGGLGHGRVLDEDRLQLEGADLVPDSRPLRGRGVLLHVAPKIAGRAVLDAHSSSSDGEQHPPRSRRGVGERLSPLTYPRPRVADRACGPAAARPVGRNRPHPVLYAIGTSLPGSAPLPVPATHLTRLGASGRSGRPEDHFLCPPAAGGPPPSRHGTALDHIHPLLRRRRSRRRGDPARSPAGGEDRARGGGGPARTDAAPPHARCPARGRPDGSLVPSRFLPAQELAGRALGGPSRDHAVGGDPSRRRPGATKPSVTVRLLTTTDVRLIT